MNFDINDISNKIISHKYFQLSKNVIENNDNHTDDPVYEHMLRTFEKAMELSTGDLITDPEPNQEFTKLMETQIDGINKKYLLQIVSLIHDIGKIIVFENDDNEIPLKKTNSDGKTHFPTHEYWGSIIAKEMLEEFDFPNTAIDFICKCIRLHNSGFDFWFKEISNEDRLYELKLRSENLHAELIFGTYCDLFYGNGFKDQLHLPLEILNMPQTYQNLEVKTI